MKRWLIQVGVYCAVGGAVLIIFGVDGWRAILIAGAAFAALASVRWWPTGHYGVWPRSPQRSYGGGTYQVTNLAARLEARRKQNTAPDLAMQHRLRHVAIAKLARNDISWTDDTAAAEQALGKNIHAALSAEKFNPDLPTIERIVAAIENLDRKGQQ
jgi:hypothetical protein